MGLHDQVAAAALRDGDTPEQFRRAAQQHANAFWFYAIIGAAVWYFAGWGWSAIPVALAAFTALQSVSATRTAQKLSSLSRDPGTVSPARGLPEEVDLNDILQVSLIDDIRQRYSALLADESDPYAACMFRPVSALPYPKAMIERALTALLDFVEGRRSSTLLDSSIRTPEVAETLRVSRNALADFIEVPHETLPTDPKKNLVVGVQLRGT